METIYDPLRRKQVALTPEESVRQKTIIWLTNKGYSQNLMMSECSFHHSNMLYRADIIVFDKNLMPYILVECKAPDVPLSGTVISQGLRYNKALNVRYIIFTNGSKVRIYSRISDKGVYISIPEEQFI